MKVSFLQPFVFEPEIVVGAIIDGFDTINNRVEYTPIVLPPTPIQDVMDAGPMWLVNHIAEPFMVFFTMADAEQFLFETFSGFMKGTLSPKGVEALLERHHGEVRSKDEYGLEGLTGGYLPN